MPPAIAPTCPISRSQYPGNFNGNPVTFPTPPVATDLDSLIAAVNALRDVLRQFTGQWTVNNIQQPGTPNKKKEGNTYYSQYPEWDQVGMETMAGFVFHKDKKGTDFNQKAAVQRINQITFKNRSQEDPDFIWAYYKALDAVVGSSGVG